MTPDKGARRRAPKKPAEVVVARAPSLDPGPPYVARWRPGAVSERDVAWPPRERVAIAHAAQKLEAAGPRLAHPHSSAVQGDAGKGLRELRPRGGRSRWRPIYRQASAGSFVILAVAPEAMIDRAGFDAAVGRARQRWEALRND